MRFVNELSSANRILEVETNMLCPNHVVNFELIMKEIVLEIYFSFPISAI